MDVHSVPAGLRTALGREATAGLLELLNLSHREEREAVVTAYTERLERRVVDEVAKVRVDVAQLGGMLRQEMAAGRVELFKWCFLFWIGQVFAVGGLMSVMLRLLR